MLPGNISNLARVRFPPSGTAPGNVDGPASSTNNALVLFNGTTGKLIKDSVDLTYVSPTLSVPDAFVVSSAGSIGLTAGGTNKAVTIRSKGTSPVSIGNATALPSAPSGFGWQLGTYGIIEGIGDGGFVQFRHTNGSAASPSAVLNNESLGYLGFNGYKATAYSGDTGSFGFNATQNWTDSANGTRFDVGTTPNGSTSVSTRLSVGNYGKLALTPGAGSQAAWGVVGSTFSQSSATITDSSSSGTVATAIANSFSQPTFAASSATTFTDAANLYIAGDVAAGTNVTLTNSYGLWNAGKTRLDGAVFLTGKITTYNNVATAGMGVVAIRAAGRVTAQSAANASISTFTVGAADGSFEVSANMNVTAATALVTTLTCTYMDESNTARTMIFPVAQLAGSFIAAGAITGTGAWESPVLHIRCKAATAITILTSAGTFNTVTYTAEGIIKQVA